MRQCRVSSDINAAAAESRYISCEYGSKSGRRLLFRDVNQGNRGDLKKIEVSPNSYVKVTEYNIIWDDRMTSTAGAEGAEID